MNFFDDITAYLDTGAISPKDCKLTLDEDLAELLGIIKGDGCITPNGIWCFNTEIEIPLFFASLCERVFNINKNKIRISIRTPDYSPKEKISNALIERDYKNIRFEKISKFTYSCKKTLYCFYIGSTILSKIVKGIMIDFKGLLKTLPTEVKAAYICGFASAEGCISNRKIWLTNKDKNELEFIKKLLCDLGISSFGPVLKRNGIFNLYIGGKNNLIKFSRFITFGKNRCRNEKLAKVLNSYVLKNRTERIQKILQTLDRPKTTKDISKLIGIKYSWTSSTLNYMVKSGVLQTNNVLRNRLYSIASDEA